MKVIQFILFFLPISCNLNAQQQGIYLSLDSALAHLEDVKYLRLIDAKLESLPAEVCDMINMVELDVTGNYLTGLPILFGKSYSIKISEFVFQ